MFFISDTLFGTVSIFSWGCGLWGKKTIRKNFNNQGVISSRFVCLGGERVLILGEH